MYVSERLHLGCKTSPQETHFIGWDDHDPGYHTGNMIQDRHGEIIMTCPNSETTLKWYFYFFLLSINSHQKEKKYLTNTGETCRCK